MDQTSDKVAGLEKGLHAHEVQCEERWKTTFHRLDSIEDTLARIEGRIIRSAGGIILFLAGIIASFLLTGVPLG